MKKIIKKNLLYYIPLVVMFIINIVLAETTSGKLGWLTCIFLATGNVINCVLYEKRYEILRETAQGIFDKYRKVIEEKGNDK